MSLNITTLTCEYNNTCADNNGLLFWPEIDIEFGVEALILVHVLTMFISIPGNLLVIFIITHNRTLHEEPAYLLICSVSCADLLVSLIAQPLNIIVLSLGLSINFAFELVFYFCIWGFCGASAFGVVCITIDRFLYIMYPMHYIVMLSPRRTFVLIAVQWICGIAYGALPIIDIENSKFPTAVASLITIIAMTACMSIIYNQVYKNIRRLNKQQQNNTKSKKRQSNATGTIAFIVIAFFLCWFPYIITNFMNAAITYRSNSPIRGFYYWVLGLGCWNSALNVVIYGFKNNTLKSEAKKLLPSRKVSPFINSSSKSFHFKKNRVEPDSQINSNNMNTTKNIPKRFVIPAKILPVLSNVRCETIFTVASPAAIKQALEIRSATTLPTQIQRDVGFEDDDSMTTVCNSLNNITASSIDNDRVFSITESNNNKKVNGEYDNKINENHLKQKRLFLAPLAKIKECNIHPDMLVEEENEEKKEKVDKNNKTLPHINKIVNHEKKNNNIIQIKECRNIDLVDNDRYFFQYGKINFDTNKSTYYDNNIYNHRNGNDSNDGIDSIDGNNQITIVSCNSEQEVQTDSIETFKQDVTLTTE